MDPIEILIDEHKDIVRLLKVLSKASENVESGSTVDVDVFEKAIDFIRNFADKCHHFKEEGGLFTLLEEKGMPRNGGPIGMMLQEHDIGRNYVKGMSNALNRYKAGDKTQSKELVRNASEYINLLSNHIMKEENILYPMGNRFISEQDRKTLSKKF